MSEERTGGWRYQPVFQQDDEDATYSICLVFCDANDKLTSWSAEPYRFAAGYTADELSDDLCRMWIDSIRWKPVDWAEMYVGMTFERALDDLECEHLAQMVGQVMRPN